MQDKSSPDSHPESPSKPSPDNGASPEVPSGKSPSVKQRKYVKGLLDGKSKKDAALDAGFTQSRADNAKQKIDDKPAVQQLFKDVLEAAGISDEILAQIALEGLSAVDTKFATKDGVFLDERDLIAYS